MIENQGTGYKKNSVLAFLEFEQSPGKVAGL